MKKLIELWIALKFHAGEFIDSIFKNFWLVFWVMMLTGILDLIFITTKDFGFGFVTAMLYGIAYFLYTKKI